MKKIILVFVCALLAVISYGQDEDRMLEVSNLAKQYAEALCTCPVQDFMENIALDFKANKITPEEFREGMKMIGAEMIQCTRHILKQIPSFTPDEVAFFKIETQKYITEFFAAQKEAAKTQP